VVLAGALGYLAWADVQGVANKLFRGKNVLVAFHPNGTRS
jgi:hypothetical protein